MTLLQNNKLRHGVQWLLEVHKNTVSSKIN